ncbi:hypothetical protein QO003_001707 [Arthrobacter silviterrae]|uniref:Uncharacterized protein n=1 Tax=Arthrobacter silviterrae TaxID=2026658 RepID=A0ABX0DE75_9MICC|nr:hypothetical protein [Arthrobacter silviterrae]MDQ0277404.1 hypothetical protein [Arthrobacter silviterrae]NGN85237.1 hypothetical protein [Arthrobacter silviterrae]
MRHGMLPSRWRKGPWPQRRGARRQGRRHHRRTCTNMCRPRHPLVAPIRCRTFPGPSRPARARALHRILRQAGDRRATNYRTNSPESEQLAPAVPWCGARSPRVHAGAKICGRHAGVINLDGALGVELAGGADAAAAS